MSDPLHDEREELSDLASGEKKRKSAFADTLPSVDEPAPVEAAGDDLDRASSRDRYLQEHLLGIGGMGEVHLCRDRVTGRRVAMKIMEARRAQLPELRARFLREARVQGQLEHPSVVPVYDLARDSEGQRYFTMKRVSGVTLDDALYDLAARDPSTIRRFSRNKLLGIFCQLCLAVDYAHSRGVIHRDIKPGNVMIGELGEVYLLDWGLAKVVSETSGIDIQDEHGARTVEGQILGTPGYMAPEQAVSANQVDKRADVYALGAVLFEILTLQTLHMGEGARELLRSTQRGADARASVRAPERDVPPELEAVCVKATADDPQARFPTARDLYEAVERYLEGVRDVGLRRELAARHAEAAEEATMRALTSPERAVHRSRALQHAGRALALDPDSAGAQRALMTLLLEPPSGVPGEVTAALERDAFKESRFTSGLGVAVYGMMLLAASLLLATFGKSWLAALLILAPLAAATVTCAHALCVGSSYYETNKVSVSILVSLSIGASAALFGPLVLAPTLATANAVTMNISGSNRYRWIHPTLGCASVLVPFVLEWAGFIPQSYVFENNTITVVSSAVHLSPTMVQIVLPLFSLVAIVAPNLAAWRLSDAISEARRHLHVQMWHLEQLVPGRKKT